MTMLLVAIAILVGSGLAALLGQRSARFATAVGVGGAVAALLGGVVSRDSRTVRWRC